MHLKQLRKQLSSARLGAARSFATTTSLVCHLHLARTCVHVCSAFAVSVMGQTLTFVYVLCNLYQKPFGFLFRAVGGECI